ncbi:MAG: hypothetical protein ABIN58_09575 [candidate division WOR-3 bacterium]
MESVSDREVMLVQALLVLVEAVLDAVRMLEPGSKEAKILLKGIEDCGKKLSEEVNEQ